MFEAISKFFRRPPKSAPIAFEVTDKHGNTLTMCSTCQVPVVQMGAVHQCLNGCYIGESYFVRNETPCAENNYNPLEIHFCPHCHGDGREYFKEDGLWCAKLCGQCLGNSVSRIRKHDKETEDALSREMSVPLDAEGWTKCPRCNFKFLARDEAVWVDGRHKRCGQKLRISAGAG
jgi:hypothetical protein